MSGGDLKNERSRIECKADSNESKTTASVKNARRHRKPVKLLE